MSCHIHKWARNIAILLCIIAVINGCGEAEGLNSESVLLYRIDDADKFQIVDQKSYDRRYRGWHLEEISLPDPPSLGNIEQFRVVGSYAYIYDVGNMNIVKYSLSGDYISAYGYGRGQGPGEFQNIFAFSIGCDDTVWVVDSMARRISQFESDGTFINSFRPGFNAARIAALEDGRVAILAYMEPSLFVIVDETGKVERRIEFDFGESVSLYTPVYDGHLFSQSEGGFIWAPRFASYLFFFNHNGELVRRLQLIDKHDFPDNVLRADRPMSARDIERPARTIAVSVDDSIIFVNTLIREPGTTSNVLDRYDLLSGEYIDSARLPGGGSQYQVFRGLLYSTSADTTFRSFRFISGD